MCFIYVYIFAFPNASRNVAANRKQQSIILLAYIWIYIWICALTYTRTFSNITCHNKVPASASKTQSITITAPWQIQFNLPSQVNIYTKQHRFCRQLGRRFVWSHRHNSCSHTHTHTRTQKQQRNDTKSQQQLKRNPRINDDGTKTPQLNATNIYT